MPPPPGNPEAAIVVACLVLVDAENRYLATERPTHKSLGGYWEFPGGKVKDGESLEEALRRELREELHLKVDPLDPLTPVDHAYEFGPIHLVLLLTRCAERPALRLVKHNAHAWVNHEESAHLTWAPADRPILEELAHLLEVFPRHG